MCSVFVLSYWRPSVSCYWLILLRICSDQFASWLDNDLGTVVSTLMQLSLQSKRILVSGCIVSHSEHVRASDIGNSKNVKFIHSCYDITADEEGLMANVSCHICYVFFLSFKLFRAFNWSYEWKQAIWQKCGTCVQILWKPTNWWLTTTRSTHCALNS